MTTKRMWLADTCADLINSSENIKDLNISSCSSTSESEEEQFPCKRFKLSKGHRQYSNEWIKLDHSFKSSSASTSNTNESCFGIHSGFAQHTYGNIFNEPEFTRSISPVIGQVKFEELSPVLNRSQTSDTHNLTLSPVICTKALRKRQRRHSYPKSVIENISFCSSDSNCTFNNTQSSCTASESYSIDEFSTQQHFQPLCSNTDDCDESYYVPPPQKRKRYKKGGFAYQLQKALTKQRTNVDIWKHELYLQKLQELDISVVNVNKHLILLLKIQRFWNEFGVTVIFCRVLDDDNTYEDILQPLECKNCLLVIGFNFSDSLSLEHNKKLRMFPPYNSTSTNYNNESLVCYFNVSKLIAVK